MSHGSTVADLRLNPLMVRGSVAHGYLQRSDSVVDGLLAVDRAPHFPTFVFLLLCLGGVMW